jgi:uncharacterized membrane protein YhaH (DUF805 family)
MSGMVYCHGCGAAVHSTAPTCPHCGAPQHPARTVRPNASFGDSVTLCFRRYTQFTGRSPRAEYWYFVLFLVLVYLAAVILDAALFDGAAVFYTIASLGLLLPGLAVAIRRLHDLDRSGWWVCLSLIPLIGSIILLVWFVSPGTPGPNQFGPDPLTA